jgi:hypothetical protein
VWRRIKRAIEAYQAAPKRAASQADDDTAESLGEGGRLFLGFKVYADQGLGLVQPISECCGVGVLRVHPPAHPTNKVPEVFFGDPSLYGVKHSQITWRSTDLERVGAGAFPGSVNAPARRPPSALTQGGCLGVSRRGKTILNFT